MQERRTGESFGQAKDFFHGALDIAPEERPAQLEEWCRENSKLLYEVQ